MCVTKQSEGILEWVDHYLKIGALEPASDSDLIFAVRHFEVPRPSGNGTRVISDLRVPNNSLPHPPHISMHGPESISTLIQRNDWASVIDISDAYMHIPMHPKMANRCGLRMHGHQSLRWARLPFGWSWSPYFFTRVLRDYLQHFLTKCGDSQLRIIAYLDDILLLHPDRESCLQYSVDFMDFLSNCGWAISPKSQICKQHFTYLGWDWSTPDLKVSLTAKRLQKLHSAVMLHSKFFSARDMARLTGIISSCVEFLGIGKAHLRVLYSLKKPFGPTYNVREFRLGSAHRKALKFFSKWSPPPKSFSTPKPQLTLWSDASLSGWGGCDSNGVTTSGHWHIPDDHRPQPQSSSRIEELEIRAAVNTIRAFLPSNAKNCHILCHIDSTVACSYNERWQGQTSQPLSSPPGQEAGKGQH